MVLVPVLHGEGRAVHAQLNGQVGCRLEDGEGVHEFVSGVDRQCAYQPGLDHLRCLRAIAAHDCLDGFLARLPIDRGGCIVAADELHHRLQVVGVALRDVQGVREEDGMRGVEVAEVIVDQALIVMDARRGGGRGGEAGQRRGRRGRTGGEVHGLRHLSWGWGISERERQRGIRGGGEKGGSRGLDGKG